MGNMPIVSLRDGAIETAVFEQQTQDGKTSYSIVLNRSFKKKDSDTWENQKINFFAEDLLKISSLCERTYWKVCDLKTPKPKATATTPAPEPKLDASDDADKMPF